MKYVKRAINRFRKEVFINVHKVCYQCSSVLHVARLP